jgi:SAM-dependent methyltransferase
MTPAAPRVLGESDLQSFTLESLTTARRYHAWLSGLAVPFLGDDAVELGSGLGDYAQAWLDAGIPRLTLIERDSGRLATLRERFRTNERVRAVDIDVFDPPVANHTCLVGFNVLEHIENDVGALRAAHRLVRPGGAVVMLVPAFPFASGRFDRQVGHVRRYTKRSLRDSYELAGLLVDDLYYLNAPGLLTWFIVVRLLQMTPKDGIGVRLWDRTIVPITRAVEKRIRPPFGQSVVAVGRVPG